MARLKAKEVKVTKRQKVILKKYISKKTAEVRLKERAEIILFAAAKMSNNRIAQKMGKINTTIRLWRNRWVENFKKLEEFRCGIDGKGVTDFELEKKMLEILGDGYRCGAPVSIGEAQKEQIRAMACQKPEEHGYPFTAWSERMLEKAVKEKGIVLEISHVWVGKILKKMKSGHTKQNIGFTQK